MSDANRDFMWDAFANPGGDFGWKWYFRYNNQIPGYNEQQLKDIIKTVDACNTTQAGGPIAIQYFCDVTNEQLAAAKRYSQFYTEGLAIKCKSYVKVNLIHDLR